MSRIRMHLGVVLVGIGIAGLHLAAHATSVPFWGAHASVSIDTPIEQLRPGEFIWMGDAVSSGPMVNGAALQIADADPPNTSHRS